jgi:peptide/nickel transport system substrate-binding protein
MLSNYSRLRMRRKLRARKKAIAQTAESANKSLERHVFRRSHNWQFARRFFISWLVLIAILGGGLLFQMRSLQAEYLTIEPTSGGVYNEGVLGNVKNINPIYATSQGDTSISALLFSSLLTYDQNNQLTGDLAKEWKADATSKVYTVVLRDDIYWHDGEKVSADDVVFTYQTIQNPDAKSPYYNAWRGIKVEKINDTTVTFTLPNAYSPFFHLLTNGIIPEHKLAAISKEQLRGNMFNTREAVGSGPFKLRTIVVEKTSEAQTEEEIQLVKNPSYHRGQVQLDGFTVKTYADQGSLQQALEKKEVVGAVVDVVDENSQNMTTIRFNQTSAVMVFLNTSRPLMANAKLREALISATDPGIVAAQLNYPTSAVRSPLLKDQIGYDETILQIGQSSEKTNMLLSELGWVWSEGEPYRKKDGKELTIEFVSENTSDYSKLSEELQRQWGQYGIKTNVTLENSADISTTSLASKEYDALLYAINIGPDPDVYVYWHSSQAKPEAKPGYNFSVYSSAKADQSLEDGRSRSDPNLRTVKYKSFLEAWKADIPAIGLYQPRIAYTTNVPVYNLQEMTINTAADRYRNVHNWQINTQKIVAE